MRLPDSVLNCVAFISHDTPEIRYGGTAFVVGIPGRNNNVFLHLVTARHVADQIQHDMFVIGMNLIEGGKVLIKSGDDFKWWYHPTEQNSVDAAVAPFATACMPDYSLQYIPEAMFATDERIKKFNIGLGDEISIIGLFTRFSGTSRHSPIVRSGNIAMMPTDKIPVNYFDPMEAYLAEGRSIGGLSGSPVFVQDTVKMPAVDEKGQRRHLSGLGSPHFLGLMHGHWEVPLDFKAAEQAEAVNMGISIIVPAKKILEVIYHPELVELRKKYDANIAQEKSPSK